jgi:hypothetical protein
VEPGADEQRDWRRRIAMSKNALPPGFEIEIETGSLDTTRTTPATPRTPATSAALPDGFEIEASAPSAGSKVKGTLRALASGASFGFSDEVEAYLSSLGGRDRARELARIRDEIDAFKRDNPKTALTAEVVGAIAIPGMAGARAAGAAARAIGRGHGARVATGAGVGAAEGALAGAGHAEADRLDGARNGALVGGGIGAAIPAFAPVVKHVAEAVGSRIPGIAGHVAEARANRDIRHALEADARLAGGSADTEIPRILADAAVDRVFHGGRRSLATTGGENVQRLAREAAEASPTAQRAAREHLDLLTDERAQSAKHAYDAIYSAKPITSSQIDDMIASKPALRQADALARRELANIGEKYTAGQYTPRHLDQIDRALQDAITRAERAGSGNRVTNLSNVRDEFQRVLAKELPDLPRTQAKYAHASETIRRAPQRSEIATPSPEDRVRDIISAGVTIKTGLWTRGIDRLAEAIPGGNRERAERVMEKLLVQFNDMTKVTELIGRLSGAPMDARAAFIRRVERAAVPAASALGAAKVRETR